MNFSHKPAISVILPTFNRASKLRRAVDSVLAQSCSSWELLVIDDGSTDNTCSIVMPYVHRDSRIRYLAHSNRKAALSRNAGIQASMGRFVTFLDSDDYYLPDHLAERQAILERNPDIDLLSGGFCGDEDFYVKDCRDTSKLIHISECILCGTLFGKREVFTELGGFCDLDYAEDYDFWQRASDRFRTHSITDPKTYVYLRSEDSITSNY
ncbi:glycosyltransferase family 2 protein [Prosthecochloris sp. N3]|uniref:Glycosyltransferase family 2 protein n=1 Tax=Prosthecochloris ethylica TaxID=2743976 RepID=A0ABR9XQB0_9CHLB|nr:MULTISPECIES: glycosyltransferase family A protein [Prosthecochloris]MEC9487853.1 glycosyltransferase family A protein [Prosthecochloris sp.]MBF0585424.1 glycosyltransferase family 2 protein [Prosthecochloris ethylica]MBF0636210.1 glycosyltransferase family 2 protein [Prosthecochloris ethylica]NUK46654.1 glycosyltransferase family 2 protein [Prosthecochloris ethylica]RNA65825.1 glycosyltransferase family 2 protein [Prosthecochloris sp. ZM_2]